jgi:hypothetical protein
MSNENRSTPSRTKNRPGRRRAIVWGLIVLGLIILGLGAKFSYRWLKAQRADQFAAQGEAFFEAGKWNEAAEKYRAALQLDPLAYRPLRGAARLAARLSRPEDVDLWEEVSKLPQCTRQDRQSYAEVLLKRSKLKVAEKVIEPLLKTDPDAKTLSLAAQYARKTGDQGKAIEFGRLALKRAPADDLIRFQLAELLAASTDAREHAEARKILWELADKAGPTRQAAIEALARAPELTNEERARILQQFEALQSPAIIDSLLAADLRMQIQPDQAEQIYDQTVARWNRGEPAQIVDLARWLNFHQQPERVLSLFSLEQAMQDNQLLVARLDALATLQRWNDIENLLAHPNLTLDPSVAESFRARTAQEKNATLDAELHWNHALSLAGGDAFKLRFVANFAEQSRAHAVALKAYDQLAKFPEHADYAYRGTQRISARSGDVSVQRDAAEKISERARDDPNAVAQLAYLNLLMNADVEANATTAKELVEKYPDRLSYRIALALGYLRQNDPGLALAQFKPAGAPPIEWAKTPPAWRAVYAASLLASDQPDAAREVIATIPKDKLSPEERALIEPK